MAVSVRVWLAQEAKLQSDWLAEDQTLERKTCIGKTIASSECFGKLPMCSAPSRHTRGQHGVLTSLFSEVAILFESCYSRELRSSCLSKVQTNGTRLNTSDVASIEIADDGDPSTGPPLLIRAASRLALLATTTRA